MDICTFFQLDFHILRQSSFQNWGSVFWNTDSKWYLFCYNILNKLIDYFFPGSCRLTEWFMEWKVQRLSHVSLTTPQLPQIMTILHLCVRLLQIRSQYWYIVINESLVFIRFVLCVVHSVGFDQYLMTCIHHCSTVWHSSLP